MNDFTKAELQELYRCLKIVVTSHVAPYSNETLALKKKVHFIMQNYCNHNKEVLPLYTATGDIPSAGYCYECNSPINKKFIT